MNAQTRTEPPRPVVVIVDGYTSGNYLPPAFARAGADVVHVLSTPEPIPTMLAPDLSGYLDDFVCDTPEATAQRLAGYRPVAVVAGQEPGVVLADQLSELLGLPTNGTAQSTARRDKYRMIETLRRAGVRCADQFKSGDTEELVAWAENAGTYPVVVKPLNSAASDGVAICRDAAEVRQAAAVVLAGRTVFDEPNGEVLIQSYLAGDEFVVDMVSFAGRRYTCGVWQYRKKLVGTHNLYDYELALAEDDERVAQLVPYLDSVLTALGIDYGPSHAEVIITADGPALVEVGARLSGNMNPDLHDECLGGNQADLTALAAVRPQEFLDRYADRRFHKVREAWVCTTPTELDGVVRSVDRSVVAEIEALETVRGVNVKIKAGGRITPTVDLYTSTMRIFMSGDSTAAVERDFRHIQQIKDQVFRLRADPPRLLLLGGAGDMTLSVDVAAEALFQARERGFHTQLTNTAAALAATPIVAELADAAAEVGFERPGDSVDWALAQAAAGAGFDAVFGVREMAQVAVAEVADALGLPGNDPDAVRRIRTKDACRAALAAAGFPQPAVRLCTGTAAALAFLRESQGPWVVKPRDAMGSEGVSLVTGPADLGAALDRLPTLEPFLVEEFVEGPEFSVEGLFLGGVPTVLAVTAKEKLPPPYFVEVGHVLPAALPQADRAEIEDRVAAALTALGLRYGAFHVELWLTARGVVLGEVHGRIGGGWIHRMLPHAVPGLELFGLLCDDALGLPVAAPPNPSRAAASRYLTPGPGRLVSVEGWDRVMTHPAVLYAELTVGPGDTIRPFRSADDRVGAVVVGAETPAAAEQLARELAASVRFVTEPSGTDQDRLLSLGHGER
jgi:biotin carboxylase